MPALLAGSSRQAPPHPPAGGSRTTLGANRVRCSGCKPGFGGPSCEVCRPGFWSRGGAATAVNVCRACPDGTFTWGEGATARAACRSTTIAINTTIPVNLTTVAVFTLANATCSSSLKDALVAKYNEEKQKAAAADGFKLNLVTEVVNCSDVAGSGSGRKRSTLTGNFAVISTSSTISSVTYFNDAGAGTATTWLNIIGTTGANSNDAFSMYWGAVGQSYENAALQNLASGGAVTQGGTSFDILSADVSQFQLSGSNGAPIIISNNDYCLTAPPSSLWQLPAGIDLAAPAWQLACSSTPKGQSCTAAACDKGNGDLTATCGQDGKWSSGSGSCTPSTCEKAAAPAFPANGATFDAAAWASACRSTLQGDDCVTSTACSSGQKLSATCEYMPVAGNLIATWTKLAGSCTATSAPVQCNSAPANVPTLGGAVFSSEPWIAKCGQTLENATCTVVDAACSSGGTISAQCVKGANGAGVWTDVQGACKAAAASVQCVSAPQNVPTLGGSVFLSEPWIAACGKTQENATCSVVDAACSSNGTISAKCTKGANGAGVWTDVQGSCRAPAPLNATAACGTTPMPSAAAGWITNGAPLDAAAWAAACSQTAQGQTCSAAACGAGFTGTLSAVCQGNGQWGQLSGTCSAGTCNGAPSHVPTTGSASFIAGAWVTACGSTTRGNNCSTSSACSAGSTGTINATCDSAGNWQLTSGGCTAGTCTGAPEPGSVPTTGGASFMAGAWATACGSTMHSNNCSTSNACSAGSTGTINATCTVAGSWMYTSGACVAGTCSGAPDTGSVPTTGGASFMAGAWATACSSTTRGNNCSTSNACSAGSTGTINATCTVAGLWTYTSGTCVAGTCSGAPEPCSVPTTGGASFIAGAWATACSSTTRGNNCSTSNACSAGSTGTINATCSVAGTWTYTSGACVAGTCTGAPEPGSVPTAGGASFMAGAWATACGSTTRSNNCSTSNACSAGSTGTINATCTVAGSWMYTSGACVAGTCSGAPNTGSVPTTGDASFVPGAWATACGSTTRNKACSTSNACSAGSTGTINATCTVAGSWTYTSGTCVATLASLSFTTPAAPLVVATTQQIISTSASLGGPSTFAVSVTYARPGVLDLSNIPITLAAAGSAAAGLACTPGLASARLTTSVGSSSWTCSSSTPGTLTFSASSPNPLAGGTTLNIGPSAVITVGMPRGLELRLATNPTGSTSCSAILSSSGSALQADLLQDVSASGAAAALSVASGSAPDIQLQCSKQPVGTYELRAIVTYLSPTSSSAAELAVAAAVNTGQLCTKFPAACSALNGAGSSLTLAASQSTAETFDPAAPQPRLEISSTCPNLAATKLAVTVSNPVKPLNCTITTTYSCPGLLDLGGVSVTLSAAGAAAAGLACSPAISSSQTTPAAGGSRRQLDWRCDSNNTPGNLTFSASSTIPAPLAGSGPIAGPTIPITIGQPQGVETENLYPCTPNFRCSTPVVASAIASIQTNMLAYIQSKEVNGGSSGNVVAGGTQVVVTCADRLFTGGNYPDVIRPRAMRSATAGYFGPGSFHLRIIINYLTNSASTALADSIVSTLTGTNPPGSARDYSYTQSISQLFDSGVLRFCGGADELSFICTSWSAAGPEFDMSRSTIVHVLHFVVLVYASPFLARGAASGHAMSGTAVVAGALLDNCPLFVRAVTVELYGMTRGPVLLLEQLVAGFGRVLVGGDMPVMVQQHGRRDQVLFSRSALLGAFPDEMAAAPPAQHVLP
ncbi:hypothetical protein OEZ85_004371 [Tetradesmus obliquus]|uniref:Laminin EGF-like domain-containing protein n=1 Tax=Tetradesmus obliquus TaxID=3088 RepID=A0ABY8UL73_TETOB|nr:hypothetical protein OEZ85_004371 [Tetradesmus obliquus]